MLSLSPSLSPFTHPTGFHTSFSLYSYICARVFDVFINQYHSGNMVARSNQSCPCTSQRKGRRKRQQWGDESSVKQWGQRYRYKWEGRKGRKLKDGVTSTCPESSTLQPITTNWACVGHIYIYFLIVQILADSKDRDGRLMYGTRKKRERAFVKCYFSRANKLQWQ